MRVRGIEGLQMLARILTRGTRSPDMTNLDDRTYKCWCRGEQDRFTNENRRML